MALRRVSCILGVLGGRCLVRLPNVVARSPAIRMLSLHHSGSERDRFLPTSWRLVVLVVLCQMKQWSCSMLSADLAPRTVRRLNFDISDSRPPSGTESRETALCRLLAFTRAIIICNKACDKRLAILISHVHFTTRHRKHVMWETLHQSADVFFFRTMTSLVMWLTPVRVVHFWK